MAWPKASKLGELEASASALGSPRIVCIDGHVVLTTSGWNSGVGDDVFVVATGEHWRLDDPMHVWQSIDEHRLLASQGDYGPWFALDTRTREKIHLSDARGYPCWWEDGWAVHAHEQSGSVNGEGRLTFMNADGQGHKLATRATFPFKALPGERLLTRVDVDANTIGTLVVVDQARETAVDERVSGLGAFPDEWQRDVFYAVSDDDRSGLYRARIAAK